MTKIWSGLICAAFVAHTTSAACAGSVTIERSPDGHTFTIEATDAALADVIGILREVEPFDLEQNGPGLSGGKITSKVVGPVRVIIELVLTDNNYLLYTNARTRRVERVVVFGSRTDGGWPGGTTTPSDLSTLAKPKPQIAVSATDGTPIAPESNAVISLGIARPPSDVEPAMRRRSPRKAAGHARPRA
jgi:hypothetical protein